MKRINLCKVEYGNFEDFNLECLANGEVLNTSVKLKELPLRLKELNIHIAIFDTTSCNKVYFNTLRTSILEYSPNINLVEFNFSGNKASINK